MRRRRYVAPSTTGNWSDCGKAFTPSRKSANRRKSRCTTLIKGKVNMNSPTSTSSNSREPTNHTLGSHVSTPLREVSSMSPPVMRRTEKRRPLLPKIQEETYMRRMKKPLVEKGRTLRPVGIAKRRTTNRPLPLSAKCTPTLPVTPQKTPPTLLEPGKSKRSSSKLMRIGVHTPHTLRIQERRNSGQKSSLRQKKKAPL